MVDPSIKFLSVGGLYERGRGEERSTGEGEVGKVGCRGRVDGRAVGVSRQWKSEGKIKAANRKT